MKKIGILGICIGGTTACYSQLLKMSLDKYETHTPHVIVYNTDLHAYFSAFEDLSEGHDGKLLSLIHQDLERIKTFGVDFTIIPNNTIYSVFDKITMTNAMPLISAVNAVKETCRAHDYKNVLILGTHWLLDSNVYQSSLAQESINNMSLTRAERLVLHDAIMLSTRTGESKHTASQEIRSILDDYIDMKGADSVILGCSDLVSQYHGKLSVPTVDPMNALVSLTLAYCNK